MNEYKICFITCVNDDALYEECIRYIQALHVPDGFDIEMISVHDANSLTEGYNRAMQQTDAKYKVYLHQDTFIINKNFIFDFLEIFVDNYKIGLLGLLGTKQVPLDLEWKDKGMRFGKIYEPTQNGLQQLAFNEIENSFENVQIIDGSIMVTQYDVAWRNSFSKYSSIVHSCEFTIAGYQIVVPKQQEPWCINDMVSYDAQNELIEKTTILNEYHKELFPLVSVLIPTFNRPEMLKEALNSVIGQSYKNIEIIICDDSTNNKTELLIKEHFNNVEAIKYIKNKENMGQFENDIKCLTLANGEYVNFLMDDDLFHPDKIERMMEYLVCDYNNEVTLVTSHRQLIDIEGNYLPDWNATKRLFSEDKRIDGIEFGDFVLKNCSNFIGEPTTVLFRKKYLYEEFGVFCSRKSKCNVDLASWLSLLAEGDIVYISDTLSYFRIHGGQQLQNPNMIMGGWSDFIHFVVDAKKKGFLKKTQDVSIATETVQRLVQNSLTKFENNKSEEYIKLLENYKLLSSYTSTIGNLADISSRIDEKSRITDFMALLKENEKEFISNNYWVDKENEVFINKYFEVINYSDGSEQFLIDLFTDIDLIEIGSQNLLPYIKDWASKYHLSPVRHNLFDFIREILDENSTVLELGGGTGAITSYLSGNFREIDVIEGSLERARANRLRNKNSDNVNIYVDDLMNLNFPREKYDIATLIGVLEYIPFFSDIGRPEESCTKLLGEVYSHLNDEGILVLAIENKLGAKYFAGCVEDHNGQLFSGIMGYPNKSAITFSRHEMIVMLENAGFQNIQFYHCFPDYKLPTSIIKEDNQMYDWDIAGITRGLFKDFNYKREHLINDTLLIDSLNSARIVHEMSNSFLVVCSKSNSKNLKVEPVITKYANNDERKIKYHHKIEFHSVGDSQKVVRKPLYNNKRVDKSGDLTFTLKDDIGFKGKSLTIEAYRLLLKDDNYTSLVNLLVELKNKLHQEYYLGSTDIKGYSLVSGDAIDFCLNNLVRDITGEVKFIDKKWSFGKELAEDYVLFRSLFALYQEVNPYIRELSDYEFIWSIMNRIYPKYEVARLENCYELEIDFHNNVNRFSAKASITKKLLSEKSLYVKSKASK